MKLLLRNKISLAFLLFLVLSFLLYVALNKSTGNLYSLKTSLDDLIPVIPIFVVPYLLFYPFLIGSLVYFLIRKKRIFDELAIAYLLINLASALVYIFAQTVVLRPEVLGNDIFSSILRGVYSIDRPYSGWPSLHVAHSVLLITGWFKVSSKMGWLYFLYATVVVASTVLIKQHYVLDIVGGIMFVFLAYYLSKLIVRKDSFM